MLGTILKIGSGAAALVLVAAMSGCAAQSDATPVAMTNDGTGVGSGLVNQGRFPAPTYSQEEQPAYALTGDAQEAWPQAAGYYQVGNARVILPAAP